MRKRATRKTAARASKPRTPQVSRASRRLSPPAKAIAHQLLAWDRARVAGIEARGFDASIYKDRQDAAEAAIDADVDTWPREVLNLFMTVLEVTRTPTAALQFAVGPLSHTVPVPHATALAAMKSFAKEIGVISHLLEVAPTQWAD